MPNSSQFTCLFVPWAVIVFLVFVVITSALLSIPLLALNDSFVSCFSTVFLGSLATWMCADNLIIQKENERYAKDQKDFSWLNTRVETLEKEKRRLLLEVEYFKGKCYSLNEKLKKIKQQGMVKGKSCYF